MAEPKAQNAGEDPSMEEILQSIRRIIAEDDKQEDAPASAGSGTPDLSSEVLELTEMLQEDGSILSLEGENSAAAPIDVLANIDSVLSEEMLAQEIPATTTVEEPYKERALESFAMEETLPAPITQDNALLSDGAAMASEQSFRKLSRPQNPSPRRTAPLSFRSGDTVEDLVVEALKPMLKEWLDVNLPALVERIVEREVRRVSGE